MGGLPPTKNLNPLLARWGTRLMSSPLRHVILVVGCFVVMQFCGCPNPARHYLRIEYRNKWKDKYRVSIQDGGSYLTVYSVSYFDNDFFDYYKFVVNIQYKKSLRSDLWETRQPNVKVWIDDIEMSSNGVNQIVDTLDKHERTHLSYSFILGPKPLFEDLLLEKYHDKSLHKIRFKIWTDNSITYDGRPLLPDTLYAIDEKLFDFHPKYLENN